MTRPFITQSPGRRIRSSRGDGVPTALPRPQRAAPKPGPITHERDAYDFIVRLVYDRCRIRLHDGKEALITARLRKRMRHHQIESLAEFCEFLRSRADESELTLVIDALTTNYTHFLRESDHFQFIVDSALPALLGDSRRSFRIWSAACSTGEEPYTLAMFLHQSYPPDRGWDWQILASDISTRVLAEARRAVYPEDRLRDIPSDWLHRFFQKGTGSWADFLRVKKVLSDRVAFSQINLTGAFHHSRRFELILCRNVMIYFDRTTQQDLTQRLCQSLVPHGFLIVGHSESLHGLDLPLRCLRPSIYQCL